jgi:SWI/SNF-related matrix-associated actin-dependent regulator of chromatin subfamily D
MFSKKREAGAGPILRTLRMCIYNTHANQYGQYSVGKTDTPTWTLRVEGAMTGEKPDDMPKFSYFIKHLSIELDKSLYKNGEDFVEWDNRRHLGETEGFEVTREGHRNVKCKIIVEINYPTQLYTLSAKVRELIKCPPVQTHDNVIRGFFMYCREKKLEKDYETENIICDDKLQSLFGVDSFSFADLPRLVRPHLLVPPPVAIDYVVDLTKSPEETMQCFDIIVQQPNVTSLRKIKDTKEIVLLDRKVSDLVQKIAASSKRHKFLSSFASDPAGFLHTMVRSDARDTEFLEAQDVTVRKCWGFFFL